MIQRKNINTPIGKMVALANDDGLLLLEFIEQKNIEKRLFHIEKSYGQTIEIGHCLLFSELEIQLEEYFQKKRNSFSIQLNLMGTNFQGKIWKLLTEIPYGQTISYHELSNRAGSTNLTRAVASANSKNPVAILVPCHRVIGKSGQLTGYAGGLWRKQWLLELENAFQQEKIEF
jgi:O-6-methylguanine DNA methyltransferase